VQRSFRREQLSELTLPVAFALMEGGFVGVIADKVYHVPPWVLALITAAPMFGNLSSTLWGRLANARMKVPVIVALQIATVACLLAVSLSPGGSGGAWVLVTSLILSRVLLAGIVTVRSVVWSLNYDRAVRARITGRLQIIASLVTVAVSSGGAVLLDAAPENFRWLYLGAALLGCLGALAFSRVWVLGEKRQLVLERRGSHDTETNPIGFFAILREDVGYARYQLYQFTAGTANMLIEAPLIYLVSRELGASYTASIGISMVIPFAVSVLTLPVWAGHLDKVHVTEFRARQSVFWVVAQLVMWIGAMLSSLIGLALGRMVLGIARGGGSLAWQLGHNDFANRNQLAAYMGVHVTLTGLRGAFAPFVGIWLYLGWGPVPALGAHLFLLSAALSLVAGLGFRALHRQTQDVD
jgi:MFS family permease